MAEYFAEQRPPSLHLPLDDVGGEVMQQGQFLVTRGDPARQIPACGSSHASGLAGMEPGIPGLLGLRPNYIRAQLGLRNRS